MVGAIALRADFEARFTEVPQEALISTMQADQKYFCLTDKAGTLQPYFIFITNIESKDPQQIIEGNGACVRVWLMLSSSFTRSKTAIICADRKLEKLVCSKINWAQFRKSLGRIAIAGCLYCSLNAAARSQD